jgi:transposase-like protein
MIMTFFEFNEKFPTERAAIEYFFHIRYNDRLTCPHCGTNFKVYRYRNRTKACKCTFCNNTFSPFSNTIFEKSSTDMRKWFYAIHLFLNGKKGISGCQLQRELGVTYKTAWRMLKQIRTAMGNADMKKSFDIFVEIDETYIGGKPRKENIVIDANGAIVLPEKEPSKRGRGTDKTPVIGVKERSSKHVYAQVALPNSAGQKLTGKQLLAILDKVCADATTVATDDFRSYNILDRKHANNFTHVTVNHSLGQFANGNIHTNNIENFWSIMKRGIYGIYHHVSNKYLQRYVNEFCYRQNNNGSSEIFTKLLKQCINTG